MTPLNQVTIHVIARREDTFAMAEQFLTFVLKDDPRFNTSTQQIVEMLVKNVEPEEFFNDRRGKVERFEKAIRETFRGKQINPYIFDIIPEVRNEPNKLYQHYLKQQKFGYVHFFMKCHCKLKGSCAFFRIMCLFEDSQNHFFVTFKYLKFDKWNHNHLNHSFFYL